MIAQPTLLKAFRIARELGKHVDDVLDNCSSLRLNQWIAYLQLTPEDFRAKPAAPVDGDIRSFFSAYRDSNLKPEG